MARKRKEDAEKTRRRILASALSLFVKKGYEKTTFNDIAARLKMTKGAVYWHFESKERLLVELVEEALAKFRRQLEELMPHGELTFPKVADMMKPSGLGRGCELDIADKRSHRTKTPRESQGPKRFPASLALSALSRKRTCSRSLRMPRWA